MIDSTAFRTTQALSDAGEKGPGDAKPRTGQRPDSLTNKVPVP